MLKRRIDRLEIGKFKKHEAEADKAAALAEAAAKRVEMLENEVRRLEQAATEANGRYTPSQTTEQSSMRASESKAQPSNESPEIRQ